MDKKYVVFAVVLSFIFLGLGFFLGSNIAKPQGIILNNAAIVSHDSVFLDKSYEREYSQYLSGVVVSIGENEWVIEKEGERISVLHDATGAKYLGSSFQKNPLYVVHYKNGTSAFSDKSAIEIGDKVTIRTTTYLNNGITIISTIMKSES